ncbi:uncharacterized protein LOC125514612 [Triticum urartu]|uniref:uncharacterized protein LOC125514612 n=1 Tax=Triticum urartu TaxID=4572 RepID=UPI002044B79B|nr:uncharacterized protein LOC125514612 [Triticum urartu]
MPAAPAVGSSGHVADGRASCLGNLLRPHPPARPGPGAPVPVRGHTVETIESSGDTAADNLLLSEDGHGDSTECSSSFGPSCSVSDDETKSGMHDMEVDSPFLGNFNVDGAASLPKMARQKQVTAEWRKAVRPIMWRCQWLELRMKELSSQVAKYDRELALISHEKDLQSEMIATDSSGPELAKQDAQGHDRNIMKRRQRQRLEDIVDTSLYMDSHQILSYYHESKNRNSGAETDGLLIYDDAVAEDTKRRVPDNTLPESKETDRVLEQYSLTDILRTIDSIQSRVLRLQGHLSKVCSNHTQVKVPPKSQKAQTQLASCKKDGHHPQKKRDLNSLLQEEDKPRPLVGVPTALSDRCTDYVMECGKRNIAEEGATQPYAKKVTFETLFGADNPLIDHTHLGELYKENADDVLIDNRAALVEGYQQFEKVKQEAQNHVELANKVANTLLSRGEETVARQVVKLEPVYEIAPSVKQVGPGNKRSKKPKKKSGSSLPPLEEQIEKSPDVPAKKRTVKDLHNLKNEKPVFVAVDTRRSQRVRKPKKYGSD